MRRLFPEARDLHLDDLYDGLVLDDGTTRRSFVALGMVASLDGAATVAGRSAQLGGDADRVAFERLRGACDAILVGAGTVRVEGYRPPTGDGARRAARRQRGLAEVPRLVIVSGSLVLPREHAVFSDPAHPPLVVTHDQAPPHRLEAIGEVAEVVRVGAGGQVDAAGLLRLLADRGYARVLCEGGPTLAGALLDADLIDEVFLTLAPTLVGGGASRIVDLDREVVRRLQAVSLHEHDGDLLLRYRRSHER